MLLLLVPARVDNIFIALVLQVENETKLSRTAIYIGTTSILFTIRKFNSAIRP